MTFTSSNTLTVAAMKSDTLKTQQNISSGVLFGVGKPDR